MRKLNVFKTFMLSLSFVGASIALAGCKDEVKIKSVEVKDNIVELYVNHGEELDLSSIILQATFSNGETKEITSADFTINEINTDQVGNQTLIITYEGKTIEIVVHVVKTMQSIAITGLTNTTVNYNPAGGTYSPAGLQVTITYSDGTTAVVTDTENLSYSAVALNQVGTFPFVVSYNGLQASANITIQRVYTESQVTDVANRLLEGGNVATFLSNLKFVDNYNNNTHEEFAYAGHESDFTVKIDGENLTAFDSSDLGAHVLTVTHAGRTATHNFTVYNQVESIAITAGNNATGYQYQELDLSGLTIQTTSLNGDHDNLNLNSAFLSITEINTTISGEEKTATITYNDGTTTCTTTFTYSVVAFDSISVEGVEEKAYLYVPYDITEMRVYLEYVDDHRIEITESAKLGLKIQDQDLEILNDIIVDGSVTTNKVTFSYDNIAATNTTFNIPVIGIESIAYVSGISGYQYQEPTVANLTITATYTDDHQETFTTGATTSNVDSAVGTVRVLFHDQYIDTNYANVALDHVTVSGLTNVEQTKALDKSTMVVKAVYVNEHEVVLTSAEYEITQDVDTNQLGVQEFKVTYQEMIGSQNVTVVKNQNQYIVGYKNPTSVTNYKNAVLNTYTSTTQTENVNKGFAKVYNSSVVDEETIYKVGSDNAFIFEPVVTYYDEEVEHTIELTSFEKTITLEEYDAGAFTPLTTEQKNQILTVTGNKYQFDSSANGTIYRMTVVPTTTDEDELEAITESGAGSFIFQVVSGWNVYTAADLSVFDNFNAQLNVADTSEFNYVTPDTSNYDASGKWTTLKTENGIALNNSATALILHRNIILTWEDIPSVHTYAQPTQENPNQRFFVDRDSDRYGSVYVRYLTNENDSFTIEGNFFTIDSSNLPVAIREAGNNEDTEGVPIVAHSTLFKVCGNETSGAIAQTQHFNINNLSMLGNSNKSENNVNWGGIISFKIETCNSDINNCLVRSHYIAMMYNGNCAAANDVISNIKNTNMFDSNNSLIYCSEARHLNLENCNLIGAGGPVMINDYNYDNIYRNDDNTNTYTFNSDNEAIDEYGNKIPLPGTERATNVTVKNCVLESYVVGTEPWFSSFGKIKNTDFYVGTYFAGLIRSFNNLYANKGYHKTYVTDNQEMNIIALYKSGKAATISADSYQVVYGSFADYTVDQYGNLVNPYPMDATKTNSAYPIFATSNAQLTFCLGDKDNDAGYQAFLDASGLTDSAILYNLYYSRKYDIGFQGFLAGYYENYLTPEQKAQISQAEFVAANLDNLELYVACWQNKYTAFQQFCIGYYNSQLTTEQKAAFGNSTDAFTTYGLTNDDVYYGYVMTLQYVGVPGDATGTNWAADHAPVAAVVDTANDYLYIYFNNGCVFILGLFPNV